MGKAKHDNDSNRKKEIQFGKYKGFVKKNKTSTPNTPFEFEMALVDIPELELSRCQTLTMLEPYIKTPKK